MKHWKYIQFPEQDELLADLTAWFPSTGLMETLENWNPIPVDALMAAVPRLQRGLEHFGVKATYAVCIYKGKGDPRSQDVASRAEPLIHIDNMPGVKARLLFPVLNTAGSYTVFYKSDKEGNFQPYDQGRRSYQFDAADCTEVDRVELVKPIILRIDKPHAVHCNMETLPRVSLSLRLDKDPVRWMLTL